MSTLRLRLRLQLRQAVVRRCRASAGQRCQYFIILQTPQGSSTQPRSKRSASTRLSHWRSTKGRSQTRCVFITFSSHFIVVFSRFHRVSLSQGFRAGQHFEEDNIVAQAREIKAVNPNVSVLSYTHRNAYPFYRIRWDFEAHEEWWAIINATTHKFSEIKMPNFNCSSVPLTQDICIHFGA